mgnify:CR=1 FL=1
MSVLHNDTTGITCTVTVGSESPIRRLVSHGAALQDVAARPDAQAVTVPVQLPYAARVREYAAAVTDAFDLDADYVIHAAAMPHYGDG